MHRSSPHPLTPSPVPLHALRRATATWFVVASVGQWAFVLFILGFYGRHVLAGDLEALNAKPHITGYVAGDLLGNVQWLGHVFLGGAATFAGILQLLPAVRRRWPAVHRWTGRVFLVAALAATLGGFYLTWIRGSQLNLASAVSTSLNGLLILVFCTLAWRRARLRDIAGHRQHALRAYLLVNGVWFLRIGIVPAGAVMSALGHRLGYDGAIFLAISYLSWIAPLACLELYLAAERSPRAGFQRGVAVFFFLLAMLTALGIAGAVMFMWWPAL